MIFFPVLKFPGELKCREIRGVKLVDVDGNESDEITFSDPRTVCVDDTMMIRISNDLIKDLEAFKKAERG